MREKKWKIHAGKGEAKKYEVAERKKIMRIEFAIGGVTSNPCLS